MSTEEKPAPFGPSSPTITEEQAMGNRAVLTFKDSSASVGVYVHWVGDPESVEKILVLCRERGYRTPEDDSAYALARLVEGSEPLYALPVAQPSEDRDAWIDEHVDTFLAQYNDVYCDQRRAGVGGGDAERAAMRQVLLLAIGAAPVAQPAKQEWLDEARTVLSSFERPKAQPSVVDLATPGGGTEAGPEEDRIEEAYWRFDARHKGYGQWKEAPQSERDAFKAEMRNALAAEKTRAEMRLVANGWRKPVAQPSKEWLDEAMRLAFQNHMRGKQYGEDETADAKHDFDAGFHAALRAHLEKR